MSDHSLPVKAPANDIWKRGVYRPGDGDRATPTRPGSLDAKVLPSVYGEQLRYPDGRVEKTK